MAPACRCVPRKSLAAPVSNRMARQKPARSNSSRYGPRNRGMRRVSQCGTQTRSLIRPASKAPPPRTPVSNDPTSPNACCGKPTRRGVTEAPRYAVPGDGSAWIWNTATELFPQAIQILDRHHAKDALHRTAHAIFGAGSPEAKPWATTRCTELDEGKLQAIVRALRSHIGSSAEAAKCAKNIIRNRRRMRYPKFHAQGLCTSTGVPEAGCKVAIGTRLIRAGMHWSVSGANAIIALRCAKLSGRFEDFWERRAIPLKAAA
jgi:hypothetical protein